MMERVINASLREFATYPNSFMLYPIGCPNARFRTMYKYMDLETAIRCLSHNNIRFVQPSEWPDNYENHFYNANYVNITDNSTVTPKFWACCFTTSKMCEASWNAYRYGKQGLGCRCVKFKLNRSKFRDALRSDQRIEYSFEGFMNYDFTDYEIQNIHRKSSKYYQNIFGDKFNLSWYFYLMLIKRSAFRYENEFRFFLTSGKIDEQVKEIYINVDWASVIKSVEVDKDCTDIEIEVLKRYLKDAGTKKEILDSIKKVSLYDDPNKNITIE